jgi:cobaltochelatase CobS
LTREPLTKLFDVRLVNAIRNGAGESIEADVIPVRTDGTEKFVPLRNDGYVFPLEPLVDIIIAIDENIPCLIWGPHGSGKSTIAEQIAVRTNRPTMRLQHSVDTERADVVGQWVLEGDKTTFHYGPLARAMLYGMIYIADEYDFALPNVLSVYQAVLEGEPLIIPNAPEHMAIVKPHPDFRFIATGNTNGAGDETGLYQGTQLQNAANYSRFGVTVHLGYTTAEPDILKKKFGEIPAVDLKQLMDLVKAIRTAYDNREITNIISTRELINVTRLAILRGRDKLNFKYGIDKGFCNRMSSIDAAAIRNIVQRVFDA